MKSFLILVSVVLSTLTAQAYVYYNNPTYCRMEWNCEVVSTDFKVAQKFCDQEAFAKEVATVYEFAKGDFKQNFKGYACFERTSNN